MKMTMIILKVMMATRRWWGYSCTSSKSLVATTNYNCPLQKKIIVRQLSFFFFKNIIIIQAHQPRVWLPHPIIIAQCKIPCQATQCQPHPPWWTFFMVFMMFSMAVIMIITLLVEIHLRWKIAVRLRQRRSNYIIIEEGGISLSLPCDSQRNASAGNIDAGKNRQIGGGG